MREKLIELMEGAESAVYWDSSDKSFIEKIADHLIANGVTIPVRCKDCDKGELYSNCPCYIFCMEHHRLVEKNDFCSYGERKDND